MLKRIIRPKKSISEAESEESEKDKKEQEPSAYEKRGLVYQLKKRD